MSVTVEADDAEQWQMSNRPQFPHEPDPNRFFCLSPIQAVIIGYV